MLTHEENQLITHIGAGTPMGDTMRRYWIPALLAWELPEPDCPPVRVKLLGEDWWLSAIRKGAWDFSASSVRTAAPRSSSAATRSAGCAAHITAGSSTWADAVST